MFDYITLLDTFCVAIYAIRLRTPRIEKLTIGIYQRVYTSDREHSSLVIGHPPSQVYANCQQTE